MSRNFSNWIQAYCEYTSHLESPTTFHLWTGIGTIAGALRGKVFIDMGYFRWRPNFFIIFVAPPGVISKSTTADVGFSLLRSIDEINFGPESVTWQALTEAFAEAEIAVPEIGESMSALTIVASELGTFFDPRNRELVDVLNNLWDGRRVPWRRRTKGEGTTEIKNPWLNFLGCTTPSWIQENFPQYAIGGGFTSRTIFVFGETKRKFIAYPKKEMDAEGQFFPTMRAQLISDLRVIAKITGEYRLDDEAIRWGEEWYEHHWTNENEHIDREVHGGYLSRKQTHIHKVALVLAASKHSDRIITKDELIAADGLVSSLEPNFRQVFSGMSANKDVHNMMLIGVALAKLGRCEKRNLYRRVMTYMTWQQYELAVESLIAAGTVQFLPSGSSIILLSTQGKAPSHGDIEAQMPSRVVVPLHASPPDEPVASGSSPESPSKSSAAVQGLPH